MMPRIIHSNHFSVKASIGVDNHVAAITLAKSDSGRLEVGQWAQIVKGRYQGNVGAHNRGGGIGGEASCSSLHTAAEIYIAGFIDIRQAQMTSAYPTAHSQPLQPHPIRVFWGNQT